MTHPPKNDQLSTSDHTLSTVCELLANATRRAAVQFFIAEETDTAELDTLVDHVHKEVDAITTPEQARIALVHKHLPKLADYDVVAYDGRSKTVHFHEAQRLDQFLTLVEENGVRS